MSAMALIASIRLYLRMIKFSHSVFALPFALTAALIAAGGVPELRVVFWIVVAMVGARSGAMGLNRVIDRKIDAENPRTSGREMPTGAIMVAEATIFSLLSFGVFVLAAWQLNPLCLKLSPVAIAIVVLYSYTKRFTWASHFVLGLALAIAPVGAWIAVTGGFDPRVATLALAVIFWLAGFDTLYALQDVDFDRTHGLKSIPARFGVRRALKLAALFHALTIVFLVLAGLFFELGALYGGGMLVVAGLFAYEHSLLKPDDLSRLDMAFFNMNGYISVTVFVFTLLDLMVF